MDVSEQILGPHEEAGMCKHQLEFKVCSTDDAEKGQ